MMQARGDGQFRERASRLIRLFQRISPLAPAADSAIHRKHVRVPHFLQAVGRERGPEAATTIQHQRSTEVGILAFNVALDNPFAQVDRTGQMIPVVFVVFADVNQNKLLASIDARFDFVDVGLAHALLGVFDYLQETRWMLLRHTLGLWQHLNSGRGRLAQPWQARDVIAFLANSQSSQRKSKLTLAPTPPYYVRD